jgi:hypothetical protein
VNWDKKAGKWRAQISIPASGKRENLGYFDDEEEGALAYDRCACALHVAALRF